jgi:arylsulfatase A-like enzyme
MTIPNIIFIVLDTLRGDSVFSNYKNVKLTTYLKDLLESSIYFENCIANAPWTLPSHMNMFTGLYQTQASLVNNELEKLSNKIPILTEILKEMGYSTFCFTENAFISKIYGLTRGFDIVKNVWDWNPWIRLKYKLSNFITFLERIDIFLNGRIKNKIFLKLWVYLRDRIKNVLKNIIKRLFLKDIIFKLKNNTINDLEQYKIQIEKHINKKPCYLFFNFLATHDPYIPVKQSFKLFDITSKDFKIIRNILLNPIKARLDINLKSKFLSEKQVKTIKKLYDACVFSADIIVKKTLSILRELNLLDDSYIIITSDHGEHLGGRLDHYFWEHNTYQSVYEPLVKVPLLIYNKQFKKRIIKEQVQLKDLFHTIIHLTGLSSHYLNLNKSILHQIETNDTPEYIFGEYPNPKEEMHRLINSHRRTITKYLTPKIFNNLRFVRSNLYKYIKYDNLPIEEFYDLLNDPNEQNNIFDKNIEEYKKMKLFLENQLKLIWDPEIIRDLITKKEKELVKNIISGFKIQNI